MNKRSREELFDAIVSAAFMEYWDRELEKMPSDEELKTKYPPSQKGLRTAKRLEKRRKYGKAPIIVYLQRASVIVLVMIAAFTAILATSPAIRASVGDNVTSWFADHMVIDFTKDPVPPVPEKESEQPADSETEAEDETETETATVESLKIGYIPDGFEMISEEEKNSVRNYMYASETGYLVINISTPESSSISVDTQMSDYEELMIDGRKTYLIYNSAEQMGTIVTGNDNYVISVTGIIEKDSLIEIFKNIK